MWECLHELDVSFGRAETNWLGVGAGFEGQIFLQSVQGDMGATLTMKVREQDIDDLITALQYAKLVSQENKNKER